MLGIFCPPSSRGRFHKRFCAPTPNFRTLRPTFEKLFTGAKARRKRWAQGAKPFMKSTPDTYFEMTNNKQSLNRFDFKIYARPSVLRGTNKFIIRSSM